MREIKFRAWDKDLKDVTEPFYVGSQMSMVYEPEMQYTGLKDKNGKEIYEGDIIKINTLMNVAESDDDIFETKEIEQEIISKVIYKYASFELETIQEDEYLKGWGFFGEDVDQEVIEVIGNIYENKELLNETE